MTPRLNSQAFSRSIFFTGIWVTSNSIFSCGVSLGAKSIDNAFLTVFKTFPCKPFLKHKSHLPSRNIMVCPFLIPSNVIQVLNAINPGKTCSKLAQLLHKQFTFDKVFQGWGRRVLPKNLGGSCGTVLQAVTLFQTKMCDFPTLFQRTLNLLHLRKHLRKASISQLKYLVLKTVPDQRAQEAIPYS